uniref:CCHC-type domain-containing protein n=1 Tax=Cannabis sativa TaxID=3483 RepID=A0A803NGH4_CANSA
MASSSTEDPIMSLKWADICLEEEEQHEVELADDCEDEEELQFDDRWCLVGRLLSGKVSDFQIFQNMIADLWKPGKGIFIKILDQNRFLFQFYHEIDIKRVIEGSPWTYDRKQLLIERLKPGQNPRLIAINTLDMWVQIHELRSGFKTDWAIREAARYIGQYVDTDPNNFQGVWRDYLRVRVRINVAEPLKRRMKFRSRKGESFYAYFKYERVPTFCFICGIMGHAEKFCDKIYDMPIEKIVKPYSIEMKAPTRRQNYMVASPLLRSGTALSSSTNTMPARSFQVNAAAVNQGMPTANYNHNISNPTSSAIDQSRFYGIDINAPKDHVISVNENTAGFQSEDTIEISDLKRKRLEAIKQNGPAVSKSDTMETDEDKSAGPTSVAIPKNVDKAVERLKLRLGFEGCYSVDSIGRKGGLALLWRVSAEAHFLNYSQHHISIEVRIPGMKQFETCHLIDLEMKGYPYTWERSGGTSRSVEISLRRAMVTRVGLTYSTREPLCGEIVADVWHTNQQQHIMDKIKLCGTCLTDWGRKLTGNFKSRISKKPPRVISDGTTTKIVGSLGTIPHNGYTTSTHPGLQNNTDQFTHAIHRRWDPEVVLDLFPPHEVVILEIPLTRTPRSISVLDK